MRSRPHLSLPALLASSGVSLLSACADPSVSVEVLPPRTSVTCSAPDVSDAALGRGLLDARATDSVHGGYVADLRLVSTGADALVDGVDVRILRDGEELAEFKDVPTGDVRLVGEGDDVRRGVLENVVLVPRAEAETLAKDGDITALEYATLLVEITPRVIDETIAALTSSFAIDVCDGCLVEEPTAEDCDGVVAPAAVCREGQDVASFTCTAGLGGAP